MFLVTQFIGLYVVNHYSPVRIIGGEVVNVSAPSLPYGLETPQIEKASDYGSFFYGIVFAFVIAIGLLFLFTKLNVKFILRAWFFIVVVIALSISFNAFIPEFKYSSFVALAIALPLGFIKIFKTNFFLHNATELLIYPGIASIFVPILNVWTVIALLILISVYDMWAVWRSQIMQKMAKYQIDNLKIFSGFFVPYMSKQLRAKIKEARRRKDKKKKIKMNIAILGGGDVIFPIIAAGVMLKTLGLMSAVFVIIGAILGLGYLFLFSEKKKFYPAMPFITTGIFLGIAASYLFL
jgi:presenilin-like A22 family membrane protease